MSKIEAGDVVVVTWTNDALFNGIGEVHQVLDVIVWAWGEENEWGRMDGLPQWNGEPMVIIEAAHRMLGVAAHPMRWVRKVEDPDGETDMGARDVFRVARNGIKR